MVSPWLGKPKSRKHLQWTCNVLSTATTAATATSITTSTSAYVCMYIYMDIYIHIYIYIILYTYTRITYTYCSAGDGMNRPITCEPYPLGASCDMKYHFTGISTNMGIFWGSKVWRWWMGCNKHVAFQCTSLFWCTLNSLALSRLGKWGIHKCP